MGLLKSSDPVSTGSIHGRSELGIVGRAAKSKGDIMHHFGFRHATKFSACLSVFVLAGMLSTGAGWAQEVATDDPVPEAVPEPAPA
jgi:hypothetical protein